MDTVLVLMTIPPAGAEGIGRVCHSKVSLGWPRREYTHAPFCVVDAAAMYLEYSSLEVNYCESPGSEEKWYVKERIQQPC